MRVSKQLIIDQAVALQDIRVTPERAAELASEVEQINRTVLKTAGRLTFDDEPAAFLRILMENA